MKKILLTLLVLAATSLPLHAAWKCKAVSNYGYGYGVSYDYYYAKRIALHECSKYTPSNDVCVIVDCWWY